MVAPAFMGITHIMPNEPSTMFKLTGKAMKFTKAEHKKINNARTALGLWAGSVTNIYGKKVDHWIKLTANAIIPTGTDESFAAIAHDLQLKENALINPAVAAFVANRPTAQEAAANFRAGYKETARVHDSILYEKEDPSNPKDSIGRTKLPLSLVPAILTAEASLAFLEGKLKYGEVNWRATSVYLSVYLDALERHIQKYSEGDDRDPITKVHHLGNAAACIGIILDAEQYGTLIDDRKLSNGNVIDRMDALSVTVAHLQKLFADKHPAHYHLEVADEFPGNDTPGSFGRNKDIS